MIVYDVETYPNCFLYGDDIAQFEISERINQHQELINHISRLAGGVMVGFNNLAFDWPIVNFILSLPRVEALDILQLSPEHYQRPV